ncbi:hypothetical protein ACIHFE_18365 [Streptomyces sp. NPDC052396]|uniref:hypothetical protein n=1 Tax=Streptomyces sp. NPDC052396 TaxID=3365689 RepID=UPI0037D8EB6D
MRGYCQDLLRGEPGTQGSQGSQGSQGEDSQGQNGLPLPGDQDTRPRAGRLPGLPADQGVTLSGGVAL